MTIPTPETIGLYGPPILILLALAWGFGRMLYLRQRDGVNVLAVLGRKRSAAERGAALVAMLINVYLLARPFWPALDSMTMGVPFTGWGVLAMALGVGLAVLSQIDMGRSWRIGLPADEGDIKDLVTGGLYQFSRNPIYVGIMLFLLGSIMVVPGPVTIGCTLGSCLFIDRIIRDEETYLRHKFGAAYIDYQKRVRRWL